MESLCSTVPKSDAQIRSHCPELNFDPDFGKKRIKVVMCNITPLLHSIHVSVQESCFNLFLATKEVDILN